MKRSFFKSAAAFAVAGLMVMGAVSSSFAVRADNGYLYYHLDHITDLPCHFIEEPVFPYRILMNKVDQYKVEPGKYYVEKRRIESEEDSGWLEYDDEDNYSYRLIYVKGIFEEPKEYWIGSWCIPWFGTWRFADIIDVEKQCHTDIRLSDTDLYEISF